MSSLRELHQQAQKYNAQLQEYNTKLQQDVALSNDSLQKLQVIVVGFCLATEEFCARGTFPASWRLPQCMPRNHVSCGICVLRQRPAAPHASMHIKLSQLQRRMLKTGCQCVHLSVNSNSKMTPMT